MTSQEAQQYLETQSNVIADMFAKGEWDALKKWYVETIANIGLQEMAQSFSGQIVDYFERMSISHQGNMAPEEIQTIVREENNHLVGRLQEREYKNAEVQQQEPKALSFRQWKVKELRGKYRKKNLMHDIVQQLSYAFNVNYNTMEHAIQNYAIPALATAGAAITAQAIYSWFKKPGNKDKIKSLPRSRYRRKSSMDNYRDRTRRSLSKIRGEEYEPSEPEGTNRFDGESLRGVLTAITAAGGDKLLPQAVEWARSMDLPPDVDEILAFEGMDKDSAGSRLYQGAIKLARALRG